MLNIYATLELKHSKNVIFWNSVGIEILVSNSFNSKNETWVHMWIL